MKVYRTKYYANSSLEEEIKRELLSKLTDDLEDERKSAESKFFENRLSYQQMKYDAAKKVLERIDEDKKRMKKENHVRNTAFDRSDKFHRRHRGNINNGLMKFARNHPELNGLIYTNDRGLNEYFRNGKTGEEYINIDEGNLASYGIPAHENGHRIDHMNGNFMNRLQSINEDFVNRMKRSGANNENFLWNRLEENDRVVLPAEFAATTNAYWDMFHNSNVSDKQLNKEMKHLMDAYDTYKYGNILLTSDDSRLGHFNITSNNPYDNLVTLPDKRLDVDMFRKLLHNSEHDLHDSPYLNHVTERQLPNLKRYLVDTLREKGIMNSATLKEFGGLSGLLDRIYKDTNFITDLKDRAKLMDELKNLKYTIKIKK